MTRGVMVAMAILALSASTGARQMTPAAGFTRNQLQDHELSIKGRHEVMARSEFQPGAQSGRHSHPGEEMGYILEGTLELTIDGQAPKTLKAGDVIFMPAGVVHNARNTGTGTLKVLSTYVLETGKPLATAVK